MTDLSRGHTTQGTGRAPNREPEFRVRFSEWLTVYDFVNNLSAKVPPSPLEKLIGAELQREASDSDDVAILEGLSTR
jgi:hypothetical protein